MMGIDVGQRLEVGSLKLKKLTPEQIEEIDEYLASVGDYGEIHLIVQNGELRYINTVTSHKAPTTSHKREMDFSKKK